MPVGKPCRVAVISTPRSGNTWLSRLLSQALDVPHRASHDMPAADWKALPDQVVLQIHLRRSPETVSLLAKHGFQVLTIARHPLDVLISVLHFAVYEDETAQWLSGCGGDESGIWGAMPRSRSFLDYATGPRAQQLLAVSADWWLRPDCVSVRYEDCVRDALGQLDRLEGELGLSRKKDLAQVVAANSLGALRKTSANNHFWKGKPGLWRELLPAAETAEIAQAHSSLLARLGYACDADPQLDAATADGNWVRHFGLELKNTLHRNKQAALQVMAQANKPAEPALVGIVKNMPLRNMPRVVLGKLLRHARSAVAPKS